jgi:hypothetical protein
MHDAEKTAYEVFNSFNDEKRFDISCRTEEPLGTRFKRQLCQPAFEIDALRTHARHYFENTREMLNQFAAGAAVPVENTPPVYVPAEFLIASQQAAYRRKMREVAAQHPVRRGAEKLHRDAQPVPASREHGGMNQRNFTSRN